MEFHLYLWQSVVSHCRATFCLLCTNVTVDCLVEMFLRDAMYIKDCCSWMIWGLFNKLLWSIKKKKRVLIEFKCLFSFTLFSIFPVREFDVFYWVACRAYYAWDAWEIRAYRRRWCSEIQGGYMHQVGSITLLRESLSGKSTCTKAKVFLRTSRFSLCLDLYS